MRKCHALSRLTRRHVIRRNVSARHSGGKWRECMRLGARGTRQFSGTSTAYVSLRPLLICTLRRRTERVFFSRVGTHDDSLILTRIRGRFVTIERYDRAHRGHCIIAIAPSLSSLPSPPRAHSRIGKLSGARTSSAIPRRLYIPTPTT